MTHLALDFGQKRSRALPCIPLGGRLLLLLGRNGHDGEASPDPLLLAPDPISFIT